MNNLLKIMLSAQLLCIPVALLAAEGDETMTSTGVEVNGSKDMGDKGLKGFTDVDMENLKKFCKPFKPSSVTIVVGKGMWSGEADMVHLKVTYDGKELCGDE